MTNAVLTETLAARVAELSHSRDRYYNEARRLRETIERKDLRIGAMRREQRVLLKRLDLYETQIARLENQLAACRRTTKGAA